MVRGNQWRDRNSQVHFLLPFYDYRTDLQSSGANYKFHPVLMDACVHFILHPSISQPPNKETIFLPHKMKRLNRYGFPTPGGSLYSHVKLVEWTPGMLPRFLTCDLTLHSLHRNKGLRRRYLRCCRDLSMFNAPHGVAKSLYCSRASSG